MRNKIIKLTDFCANRPLSKKIVLCSGCFDLLHIGHIKYLQAAKSYGDILVVSVTSDRFVNKGPGRPVFSQDVRMEQVASLYFVDFVVLSDALNTVDVINKVKPDVYVKGSDYENIETDITNNIKKEIEAVESAGGKVVFTHEVTFSSTTLINNFFDPLPEATRLFLRGLKFSSKDIFDLIDSLTSLRILVIGESIFDKYSFVDTTNVSSKHSVICSKFMRSETHYGGVLATARHVAKLSNNVAVVTPMDPTIQGEIIEAMPNIKFEFINSTDKRTIIKERFLDEKRKQLFRVDKLKDDPYYEIEDDIISKLCFDEYDIIMVNDFGHGMFTKKVVAYITEKCNKFLALNVQTNSSNKGFNLVTRYKSADYISIDLPEAKLALSSKNSDVESLAYELAKLVPSNAISITHGQYGTNVFDNRNRTFVHVPVFSTDTIDSTGAGDAYFGITSLLAYVGAPIDMIGVVGNAVGALAVRIMGNRDAIDPVLLRKYLTTLLK